VPLRVINVLWLGRVDYPTALELQQTLVHLVKEGRIGHTLLLLEHPPVITLGRNAGLANVVAPREFLESKGIEVVETNRGGDVTFHGPGQLVGYPIFDLRGFEPRLGAVDFVRKVEESLIRACGDLGVFTERIPGLTGVWTQDSPPAKIAAIGVHISRGVTSHGFALNVSTDLDYFKLIVPCGITDKPVTSLALELPRVEPPRQIPSLEDMAHVASRNFGRVFEAQSLWLESLDALMRAEPAEKEGHLPASAPGESSIPPAAHAPANQDTPARAPEAIRRLADEEDVFLA
jgi:lipoyl(octanoyl) transferase